MVLVAQPISTDGGPPAWAVDKRQNWAGQVAGEKGRPQSVKVANVYGNRRYILKVLKMHEKTFLIEA